MTDAIETLHQAPQMAKVDQEANITQIRNTLGNPDLQLTFQGIRELANAPWVEAAIYSDEAGATYWVAIEVGRLADFLFDGVEFFVDAGFTHQAGGQLLEFVPGGADCFPGGRGDDLAQCFTNSTPGLDHIFWAKHDEHNQQDERHLRQTHTQDFHTVNLS